VLKAGSDQLSAFSNPNRISRYLDALAAATRRRRTPTLVPEKQSGKPDRAAATHRQHTPNPDPETWSGSSGPGAAAAATAESAVIPAAAIHR
jgi:hypothetical protein